MLYGSCLGTVPIVSAPELLPVLMGDHWIPGLTLDTTFGNRYCSFIVCSFSNDTISDIIYWNKREKKNRYLVIYEKLKLIICFHVKIIFLLAFTHLILQSTVYLSTHMPVFFFFFFQILIIIWFPKNLGNVSNVSDRTKLHVWGLEYPTH